MGETYRLEEGGAASEDGQERKVFPESRESLKAEKDQQSQGRSSWERVETETDGEERVPGSDDQTRSDNCRLRALGQNSLLAETLCSPTTTNQ